MDGEENRPTGARRRLVTAAWLCAVVAAAALGAWSYAHASPEGRYGRSEPLDDAAVRRELAQSERTAPPSPAPPSSAPSPSPSSSSPSAPGSPTPSGPPRAHPHTSTVRFPDGIATVVAECRPDGDVRLLSWTPGDGYAVEEVHRGPAPTAVLELEPLADDDTDESDSDGTAAAVRCEHGEPRPAAVAEDDADD